MKTSHSKLTAQGQISVPAEVRKKLGVGPGSVLEWREQDDHVVVQRAARYTWDDVRIALFPEGRPEPRSLETLEKGRREYVRRKYARR